jgi:hypothetical protein
LNIAKTPQPSSGPQTTTLVPTWTHFSFQGPIDGVDSLLEHEDLEGRGCDITLFLKKTPLAKVWE